VLFIVNDYLDVALESYADGLHLGQDDLPMKVARKWLPIGKIVGISATNVEEATRAQSDGADYVAVGQYTRRPQKNLSRLSGWKP